MCNMKVQNNMRNRGPVLYWRIRKTNGKWSFRKAFVEGYQHDGYDLVKPYQEEE